MGVRAPGRRLDVRQATGAVAQAIFFLAYPFVVYAAYTRLGTRSLGALLLATWAVSLGLRARGSGAELARIARQHLPLALLIVGAMAVGNRTLLLLLPAVASLYLLWTFASSLRRGPPMVERFARAIEDDLPDFTLPYCRKVTIAWCVFLAANSLCVAALARWGPLEWWALYTGLVFYLLMGALLAGEFAIRKLWFRHYGTGAVDRLLARVFPAARTRNGRRSLAYAARRREQLGATEPASGGRPGTC